MGSALSELRWNGWLEIATSNTRLVCLGALPSSLCYQEISVDCSDSNREVVHWQDLIRYSVGYNQKSKQGPDPSSSLMKFPERRKNSPREWRDWANLYASTEISNKRDEAHQLHHANRNIVVENKQRRLTRAHSTKIPKRNGKFNETNLKMIFVSRMIRTSSSEIASEIVACHQNEMRPSRVSGKCHSNLGRVVPNEIIRERMKPFHEGKTGGDPFRIENFAFEGFFLKPIWNVLCPDVLVSAASVCPLSNRIAHSKTSEMWWIVCICFGCQSQFDNWANWIQTVEHVVNEHLMASKWDSGRYQFSPRHS